MSAYQTVLVGTDGSDSSLRAVDRAAAIAADNGAKVIVATAHPPAPRGTRRLERAAGERPRQGLPGGGRRSIYAILQDARERAHKAGAKNVEERSVVGAPISALVHLAEAVHADLLIVHTTD